MIVNLLLYLLAFGAIWLGAGFIVSSSGNFSKRLRLSPFAFSFVFLGLLTSTPEFSVGLQAVADHDAEIFVGNLLGGVVVIFLLVIPLLAIFGNGINLKGEMGKKELLFSICVIAAPSLLILDKKVTNLEGIFFIILYLLLLFFIQRKDGIFDKDNTNVMNIRRYSYIEILKLLVGIGIVFVASSVIVDKTLYFANILNISAFYISLIVVALGTNLPELTLAIRSVISGKKDIAMGDYIGSAAANTLLFGIFTLLHNGEVLTISNFLLTFLFIVGGLLLFYYFSKSNNSISRKEGALLLVIYLVFICAELIG